MVLNNSFDGYHFPSTRKFCTYYAKLVHNYKLNKFCYVQNNIIRDITPLFDLIVYIYTSLNFPLVDSVEEPIIVP